MESEEQKNLNLSSLSSMSPSSLPSLSLSSPLNPGNRDDVGIQSAKLVILANLSAFSNHDSHPGMAFAALQPT
jgi:hypothetical protein